MLVDDEIDSKKLFDINYRVGNHWTGKLEPQLNWYSDDDDDGGGGQLFFVIVVTSSDVSFSL